MKRIVIALTLMACAAFGVASSAAAAEDVHVSKKQVKKLVANAKTAADHTKIAAWYSQEADKLEAEAKGHEDLADVYKTTPAPLGSKSSIPIRAGAEHCLNIAKQIREAAKEDRALAAEHQEMAKEAGK